MAANSKTTDEKDTRPRVGPVDFLRQVDQERRKVTWPTRREWMLTTMMVFIMVVIATLFFLGVDSLIAFVVQLVLDI